MKTNEDCLNNVVIEDSDDNEQEAFNGVCEDPNSMDYVPDGAWDCMARGWEVELGGSGEPFKVISTK